MQLILANCHVALDILRLILDLIKVLLETTRIAAKAIQLERQMWAIYYSGLRNLVRFCKSIILRESETCQIVLTLHTNFWHTFIIVLLSIFLIEIVKVILIFVLQIMGVLTFELNSHNWFLFIRTKKNIKFKGYTWLYQYENCLVYLKWFEVCK